MLIDLFIGSSTFIKSKDLQSTDIDSEDSMLLYTITQDSPAGHLQYVKGGHSELISSKGPIRTFLQSDINSGYIQYVHQSGEMTGVVLFKFDVEDSEGNKLIDQDFFITVIGKDRRKSHDHLSLLLLICKCIIFSCVLYLAFFAEISFF